MDYYIRYVDLPCTVKGMTIQDENGFNNIYINSRLNIEQQQQAIRHELMHVKLKDFDSTEPLETIECRCK